MEKGQRVARAHLRRRTPRAPQLFTPNTSAANTESSEIRIAVKNCWDRAERGSPPEKTGNALVHMDAILANRVCHF